VDESSGANQSSAAIGGGSHARLCAMNVHAVKATPTARSFRYLGRARGRSWDRTSIETQGNLSQFLLCMINPIISPCTRIIGVAARSSHPSQSRVLVVISMTRRWYDLFW
jgi:hypothetical protein